MAIASPLKTAPLLFGMLLLSLSLSAHAGWMASYPNTRLSALVLPGSHDSGSYQSAGLGVSPDDPQLSWLPPALQGLVANWGLTQSQDIGQQAQLGYRYFDIRLCAYGDTVYTCHGVYMVPIGDVLSQLQTYLGSDDARSEVIVVDINHCYAMDSSLHDMVVQQLRTALGQWAANPANFAAGVDSTVSDFTNAGKNLIVTYEDAPTVAANADLLWPQSIIDSPWPNLQFLWPLEKSLSENNVRAQPDQIFVHQAQLTPDDGNIIAGFLAPHSLATTLQTFTAHYTPAEQTWMASPHGIAAVANGGIIIQDFVDNKLVNYAIEQNQRLFPDGVQAVPRQPGIEERGRR